jgi:proteasome alpha subunit
VAVAALGSVGGEGGAARTIAAHQLEVAVLDRHRKGRTFRRITGAALTALLDAGAEEATEPATEERPETPATPTQEAGKPTTSAGSADLEG